MACTPCKILFRKSGAARLGGGMFESKTLFVVGAGASAEIDLPVGSALLETIAKKLKIEFKGRVERISGDIELINAIDEYA